MREQFLRMSGRKLFHEYAVANQKLRAKQKAKDKQIDLNKQRTKRGETKFFFVQQFQRSVSWFCVAGSAILSLVPLLTETLNEVCTFSL